MGVQIYAGGGRDGFADELGIWDSGLQLCRLFDASNPEGFRERKNRIPPSQQPLFPQTFESHPGIYVIRRLAGSCFGTRYQTCNIINSC